MTGDWRPSTPALDGETLQQVLRDNAVVAIHYWAQWNNHDRAFDEVLRPLRAEFAGSVAFRSIDIDTPAGAQLAMDARLLNVPALSIWLTGRHWRTIIGVRRVNRLRNEIADAVRRSSPQSDNIEAFVREPDLARIHRWGEGCLGSLQTVYEGPEAVVYCDRSGRVLSLTPRAEGTDFTSVFIHSTSGEGPFISDADLARAVHRSLDVEARCDAQQVAGGVTPSRWWSVSGNGERVIELWTPDDLADDIAFGAIFEGIRARPRAGLLQQLWDRYTEPDRAYHNVLHISETYSALAECRERVERWQEVELALWFHDAVYDTHRHDNEERSAAWARAELLTGGAEDDVAARVHALVLATKHNAPPDGNDARLLVDADLSILAAPPDRFATYERQIRKEYAWVPDREFREARERFLRGMLARPSIYSDSAMRERHEAHARRNIEESLRRVDPAL